jgi:hypothetical protein
LKITENLRIFCDCCGVSIGPMYTAQDFVDLGPQKICLECKKLLDKNKYVILEDRPSTIVLMIRNGSKVTLDKKELRKYLRKLDRDSIGIPSNIKPT